MTYPNSLPDAYKDEVKEYFLPKILSGIEFLNNRAPNWKRKIQSEYLDMEHCNACILGQVFGDYFEALRDFISEGMIPEGQSRREFAEAHGFYIHDTRKLSHLAEEYDLYHREEEFEEEEINNSWWSLLGETWIEELNKRDGK